MSFSRSLALTTLFAVAGLSAAAGAGASEPFVFITAPEQDSYITTSNFTSFTVSGVCSENGFPVFVSSEDEEHVICRDGVFAASFDMSWRFDGPIQVTAQHRSGDGREAPISLRTFIKDTIAPTSSRLIIAEGQERVRSLTVSVQAFSEGASRMYVTHAAGCATGGSWQAIQSEFPWTLEPVNGLATVYARFSDNAGNVSPCISDSVEVELIVPPAPPSVAILTPDAGVPVNLGNQAAFLVTGHCSIDGRPVEITGAIASISICKNGSWSAELNLSAVADGSLTVHADHVSADGIAAPRASRTFLKDTVPPTGTLSIMAGARYTTTDAVNLTLASVDAREMYITNSETCSTGGVWRPFAVRADWVLGATNQLTSVYVAYRDAAGNIGPCVKDEIIHDSLPPEAPVFVRADPASPSSSTTPRIFGTAASDDTALVILYRTATCGEGHAGATGRTAFELEGIQVAVDEERITSIHGKSMDEAGNVSPCVLLTRYEHRIPAPPLPLSIQPTAVSLSSDSDHTITFRATGGKGELRYSLLEGQGEIHSVTGVYVVQAGAQGRTRVQVADGEGRKAEAEIVHTQQPSLTFDGPVRAIAVDSDGNRYFGGGFTRINGAPAPGLIALDSRGEPALTFSPAAGFDGTVNAVVDLGDGTFLMGGSFRKYRGILVGGIARVSHTGELDLGFASTAEIRGFEGEVQAIAVDTVRGSVYVGGVFKSYRGLPVRNLAKLDLSGTLDAAFSASVSNSGTDGAVHAIAVHQGFIVAGGKFSTYRGVRTGNIVRIHGETGAQDTSFALDDAAAGFDGEVRSIVMNDGAIFVGGAFLSFQGRPARGIAKLNHRGELDVLFNPEHSGNGIAGAAATVHALGLSESSLFIGGGFLEYRGTMVENLVKVGLDGTIDLEFNPPLAPLVKGAPVPEPVRGLSVTRDALYLVGSFRAYRDSLVNGVARVDLRTGVLDETFNSSGLGFSSAGRVPSVLSVAVSSDFSRIVVGGELHGSLYGGTTVGGLIKVKSDRTVDHDFISRARIPGEVWTLHVHGRAIYVGGEFSAVGAHLAQNLARLDQDGNLDPALSPQVAKGGFDKVVYALAFRNDAIYVGGDFRTYRGRLAQKVAKLSLAGELDAKFSDQGFDGAVHTLAIADSGNTLYAGGSFQHWRKQRAQRIAKIHATTGVSDLTFSPQSGKTTVINGADGDVLALAVDPLTGQVYMGGRFNRYRGEFSEKLMRLNPDGSVDRSFQAVPGGSGNVGFLGQVNAILLREDSLFIGGKMQTVNGLTVNHVALLSKTGSVDRVFSPDSGEGGVNLSPGNIIPVHALALDGKRLLVGGQFHRYRQSNVSNLVVLDFMGVEAL